jgi:mono/diheme cytochrome c family protein
MTPGFSRRHAPAIAAGVVAALLLGAGVATPISGQDGGAPLRIAGLHPGSALLGDYCVTCHDDAERAGGFSLEGFDPRRAGHDPEAWEAVVRKLRTGMMPPAGEPRPERRTIDAFAQTLEKRLDRAAGPGNPGYEPIHRLNRAEYRNAIRDLLAYDVDVASLLPADDAAEGFDNMAEVLVVSPTLIQSYVSAAMKISRWAVGDMTAPPTRAVYRPADGLDQSEHIDGMPFGTRGGVGFTHNFPLDADYEFSIAGGGVPGLGVGARGVGAPPKINVTIDGAPADVEDPAEFRIRIPAGPHRITVALADVRRQSGVDDAYGVFARPGAISEVVINGPIEAAGPGETPSRSAIFVCYPQAAAEEELCARRIVTDLASRAFREPVAADDPAIDTLMDFYAAGHAEEGFEAGIQQAIARLLVDPRFLYRLEAEPEDLAPGQAYRISDLELASRLSFFLWSSIPDAELLDVAAQDGLKNPEALESQARRMLADPRARALTENFAGQWLHLRELDGVQPEDPEFDAALRQAFREETELLFATVIAEDRSVLDLLDADFTFVNERLARHYGIEGVQGGFMRRVELPDGSPRRGLLGHGSVLTVTSVANRTSPVVRGAWILENIIGAPAPLPPPGVEANIDAPAEGAAPTTLRERLEMHREDPVCASCHRIMDPIGLSLENFDLVGRWREDDGGHPVDASGVLVDGTPLNGPEDLRAALLDRPEAFVTTLTEKLLTYALGRGLEPSDMPAVRKIVREARADDYRMSALILGVIESAPFQMKVKLDTPTEQAAGETTPRGEG